MLERVKIHLQEPEGRSPFRDKAMGRKTGYRGAGSLLDSRQAQKVFLL